MNYLESKGNNPFEIFDYKNLGSVRTMRDERNEVWFCLKDVSSILGLNNYRQTLTRLNEKGVISNDTLTTRGIQSLLFIDEFNLYELIFNSRKPEAHDFKEWVKGVIQKIRKSGSYNMIEDESIPIQVRQMNQVTKVVNLMANKLEDMQKTIKTNYNDLDDKIESNYNDLDGKIEDVDDKVDFSLARQEYLIEHGYHSVFQFAQYMGVDVRTINTNNIGRICSKVCRENGIPTGTYPDGKYEVKTYPYKVLSKVFNENVFIYENSN